MKVAVRTVVGACADVGLSVVPLRDRMVDPRTGAEVRVDGRLLLRSTWTETPELAVQLLRREVARSPVTALAHVAAQTLALAGRSDEPADTSGARSADFVVVLGHRLGEGAQPSTEILGRLAVALKAFRANPRLRILTTGDGEVLGVKESVFMRDWLVASGVPRSVIVVEPYSNDTVENILHSTQLLQSHGAKSLVLVTSASHMRRAHALMEAHLQQLGWNLHVGRIPFARETSVETPQDSRYEAFLLFKDLGRILGVWEYPQMPSV